MSVMERKCSLWRISIRTLVMLLVMVSGVVEVASGAFLDPSYFVSLDGQRQTLTTFTDPTSGSQGESGTRRSSFFTLRCGGDVRYPYLFLMLNSSSLRSIDRFNITQKFVYSSNGQVARTERHYLYSWHLEGSDKSYQSYTDKLYRDFFPFENFSSSSSSSFKAWRYIYHPFENSNEANLYKNETWIEISFQFDDAKSNKDSSFWAGHFFCGNVPCLSSLVFHNTTSESEEEEQQGNNYSSTFSLRRVDLIHQRNASSSEGINRSSASSFWLSSVSPFLLPSNKATENVTSTTARWNAISSSLPQPNYFLPPSFLNQRCVWYLECSGNGDNGDNSFMEFPLLFFNQSKTMMLSNSNTEYFQLSVGYYYGDDEIRNSTAMNTTSPSSLRNDWLIQEEKNEGLLVPTSTSSSSLTWKIIEPNLHRTAFSNGKLGFIFFDPSSWMKNKEDVLNSSSSSSSSSKKGSIESAAVAKIVFQTSKAATATMFQCGGEYGVWGAQVASLPRPCAAEVKPPSQSAFQHLQVETKEEIVLPVHFEATNFITFNDDGINGSMSPSDYTKFIEKSNSTTTIYAIPNNIFHQQCNWTLLHCPQSDIEQLGRKFLKIDGDPRREKSSSSASVQQVGGFDVLLYPNGVIGANVNPLTSNVTYFETLVAGDQLFLDGTKTSAQFWSTPNSINYNNFSNSNGVVAMGSNYLQTYIFGKGMSFWISCVNVRCSYDTTSSASSSSQDTNNKTIFNFHASPEGIAFPQHVQTDLDGYSSAHLYWRNEDCTWSLECPESMPYAAVIGNFSLHYPDSVEWKANIDGDNEQQPLGKFDGLLNGGNIKNLGYFFGGSSGWISFRSGLGSAATKYLRRQDSSGGSSSFGGVEIWLQCFPTQCSSYSKVNSTSSSLVTTTILHHQVIEISQSIPPSETTFHSSNQSHFNVIQSGGSILDDDVDRGLGGETVGDFSRKMYNNERCFYRLQCTDSHASAIYSQFNGTVKTLVIPSLEQNLSHSSSSTDTSSSFAAAGSIIDTSKNISFFTQGNILELQFSTGTEDFLSTFEENDFTLKWFCRASRCGREASLSAEDDVISVNFSQSGGGSNEMRKSLSSQKSYILSDEDGTYNESPFAINERCNYQVTCPSSFYPVLTFNMTTLNPSALKNDSVQNNDETGKVWNYTNFARVYVVFSSSSLSNGDVGEFLPPVEALNSNTTSETLSVLHDSSYFVFPHHIDSDAQATHQSILHVPPSFYSTYFERNSTINISFLAPSNVSLLELGSGFNVTVQCQPTRCFQSSFVEEQNITANNERNYNDDDDDGEPILFSSSTDDSGSKTWWEQNSAKRISSQHGIPIYANSETPFIFPNGSRCVFQPNCSSMHVQHLMLSVKQLFLSKAASSNELGLVDHENVDPLFMQKHLREQIVHIQNYSMSQQAESASLLLLPQLREDDNAYKTSFFTSGSIALVNLSLSSWNWSYFSRSATLSHYYIGTSTTTTTVSVGYDCFAEQCSRNASKDDLDPYYHDIATNTSISSSSSGIGVNPLQPWRRFPVTFTANASMGVFDTPFLPYFQTCPTYAMCPDRLKANFFYSGMPGAGNSLQFDVNSTDVVFSQNDGNTLTAPQSNLHLTSASASANFTFQTTTNYNVTTANEQNYFKATLPQNAYQIRMECTLCAETDNDGGSGNGGDGVSNNITTFPSVYLLRSVRSASAFACVTRFQCPGGMFAMLRIQGQLSSSNGKYFQVTTVNSKAKGEEKNVAKINFTYSKMNTPFDQIYISDKNEIFFVPLASSQQLSTLGYDIGFDCYESQCLNNMSVRQENVTQLLWDKIITTNNSSTPIWTFSKDKSANNSTSTILARYVEPRFLGPWTSYSAFFGERCRFWHDTCRRISPWNGKAMGVGATTVITASASNQINTNDIVQLSLSFVDSIWSLKPNMNATYLMDQTQQLPSSVMNKQYLQESFETFSMISFNSSGTPLGLSDWDFSFECVADMCPPGAKLNSSSDVSVINMATESHSAETSTQTSGATIYRWKSENLFVSKSEDTAVGGNASRFYFNALCEVSMRCHNPEYPFLGGGEDSQGSYYAAARVLSSLIPGDDILYNHTTVAYNDSFIPSMSLLKLEGQGIADDLTNQSQAMAGRQDVSVNRWRRGYFTGDGGITVLMHSSRHYNPLMNYLGFRVMLECHPYQCSSVTQPNRTQHAASVAATDVDSVLTKLTLWYTDVDGKGPTPYYIHEDCSFSFQCVGGTDFRFPVAYLPITSSLEFPGIDNYTGIYFLDNASQVISNVTRPTQLPTTYNFPTSKGYLVFNSTDAVATAEKNLNPENESSTTQSLFSQLNAAVKQEPAGFDAYLSCSICGSTDEHVIVNTTSTKYLEVRNMFFSPLNNCTLILQCSNDSEYSAVSVSAATSHRTVEFHSGVPTNETTLMYSTTFWSRIVFPSYRGVLKILNNDPAQIFGFDFTHLCLPSRCTADQLLHQIHSPKIISGSDMIFPSTASIYTGPYFDYTKAYSVGPNLYDNEYCNWEFVCPSGSFASPKIFSTLSFAQTGYLASSNMEFGGSESFIPYGLEAEFVSSSNKANVTFRTKYSSVINTYQFFLVFRCLVSQCSSNATTSNGVVPITAYPSSFSSDLDGNSATYRSAAQEKCVWNVQCPVHRNVMLSQSGNLATPGGILRVINLNSSKEEILSPPNNVLQTSKYMLQNANASKIFYSAGNTSAMGFRIDFDCVDCPMAPLRTYPKNYSFHYLREPLCFYIFECPWDQFAVLKYNGPIYNSSGLFLHLQDYQNDGTRIASVPIVNTGFAYVFSGRIGNITAVPTGGPTFIPSTGLHINVSFDCWSMRCPGEAMDSGFNSSAYKSEVEAKAVKGDGDGNNYSYIVSVDYATPVLNTQCSWSFICPNPNVHAVVEVPIAYPKTLFTVETNFGGFVPSVIQVPRYVDPNIETTSAPPTGKGGGGKGGGKGGTTFPSTIPPTTTTSSSPSTTEVSTTNINSSSSLPTTTLPATTTPIPTYIVLDNFTVDAPLPYQALDDGGAYTVMDSPMATVLVRTTSNLLATFADGSSMNYRFRFLCNAGLPDQPQCFSRRKNVVSESTIYSETVFPFYVLPSSPNSSLSPWPNFVVKNEKCHMNFSCPFAEMKLVVQWSYVGLISPYSYLRMHPLRFGYLSYPTFYPPQSTTLNTGSYIFKSNSSVEIIFQTDRHSKTSHVNLIFSCENRTETESSTITESTSLTESASPTKATKTLPFTSTESITPTVHECPLTNISAIPLSIFDLELASPPYRRELQFNLSRMVAEWATVGSAVVDDRQFRIVAFSDGPNPTGFQSFLDGNATRGQFQLHVVNETVYVVSLPDMQPYSIYYREQLFFYLGPWWFSQCAPTKFLHFATVEIFSTPKPELSNFAQKSTEIVGYTASAGGFVGTMPIDAVDAQSLAIMGLMQCSRKEEAWMVGNSRMLSPASPDPNSYVQMLLSNMAICAAVGLLHTIVYQCWKHVKKHKKPRMVTQYPSLTICIVMLLHQGSTFSTLQLLSRPKSGFDFAVGIVGLVYVFVVPIILLWIAKRTVKAHYGEYNWSPSRAPKFIQLIFFPTGRWEPKRVRRAYGGFFAGYSRSEYIWVLWPLIPGQVMAIGGVISPSTDSGCAKQFQVLASFQFFLALIILAFRPFRSHYANAMAVCSSLCVAGIIVCSSMMRTNKAAYIRFVLTCLVQVQTGITALRAIHSFVLSKVESHLNGEVTQEFQWIPLNKTKDPEESSDEEEEEGEDGTTSRAASGNQQQLGVLDAKEVPLLEKVPEVIVNYEELDSDEDPTEEGFWTRLSKSNMAKRFATMNSGGRLMIPKVHHRDSSKHGFIKIRDKNSKRGEREKILDGDSSDEEMLELLPEEFNDSSSHDDDHQQKHKQQISPEEKAKLRVLERKIWGNNISRSKKKKKGGGEEEQQMENLSQDEFGDQKGIDDDDDDLVAFDQHGFAEIDENIYHKYKSDLLNAEFDESGSSSSSSSLRKEDVKERKKKNKGIVVSGTDAAAATAVSSPLVVMASKIKKLEAKKAKPLKISTRVEQEPEEEFDELDKFFPKSKNAPITMRNDSSSPVMKKKKKSAMDVPESVSKLLQLQNNNLADDDDDDDVEILAGFRQTTIGDMHAAVVPAPPPKRKVLLPSQEFLSRQTQKLQQKESGNSIKNNPGEEKSRAFDDDYIWGDVDPRMVSMVPLTFQGQHHEKEKAEGGNLVLSTEGTARRDATIPEQREMTHRSSVPQETGVHSQQPSNTMIQQDRDDVEFLQKEQEGGNDEEKNDGTAVGLLRRKKRKQRKEEEGEVKLPPEHPRFEELSESECEELRWNML